jgi:hypothetical protein
LNVSKRGLKIFKAQTVFLLWSLVLFFWLIIYGNQKNNTRPTRKTRLPLGRSAQRNARTFLNLAQTKTQSKAQAIVRDPIYQEQHRP